MWAQRVLFPIFIFKDVLGLIFFQTCLNFAPGAWRGVPNVYGWLTWLGCSYPRRMLSCFLFKALVIVNCLFSDMEELDSKILSFPSCPLPTLSGEMGNIFPVIITFWMFELRFLMNLLLRFTQLELWGIGTAGSDFLRFIPREQRLEHNSDFVNNMKRDFLHINHISICF